MPGKRVSMRKTREVPRLHFDLKLGQRQIGRSANICQSPVLDYLVRFRAAGLSWRLPAQVRQRLLAWKEQLLPKHPAAEAVNYTLGQWTELNVLCADGAVPIDNNVSEREMKRVVLNRKNSLFVGKPRGGRTAAALASFTSTCRRHEIDPQAYLTQLLVNLPGWPVCDLDAWLPTSGSPGLPRMLSETGTPPGRASR